MSARLKSTMLKNRSHSSQTLALSFQNAAASVVTNEQMQLEKKATQNFLTRR